MMLVSVTSLTNDHLWTVPCNLNLPVLRFSTSVEFHCKFNHNIAISGLSPIISYARYGSSANLLGYWHWKMHCYFGVIKAEHFHFLLLNWPIDKVRGQMKNYLALHVVVLITRSVSQEGLHLGYTFYCKCLFKFIIFSYPYIPILPRHLSECTSSPTPFLFGVHSSLKNGLNDLVW